LEATFYRFTLYIRLTVHEKYSNTEYDQTFSQNEQNTSKFSI